MVAILLNVQYVKHKFTLCFNISLIIANDSYTDGLVQERQLQCASNGDTSFLH